MFSTIETPVIEVVTTTVGNYSFEDEAGGLKTILATGNIYTSGIPFYLITSNLNDINRIVGHKISYPAEVFFNSFLNLAEAVDTSNESRHISTS